MLFALQQRLLSLRQEFLELDWVEYDITRRVHGSPGRRPGQDASKRSHFGKRDWFIAPVVLLAQGADPGNRELS
jgi:hypothetical protein